MMKGRQRRPLQRLQSWSCRSQAVSEDTRPAGRAGSGGYGLRASYVEAAEQRLFTRCDRQRVVFGLHPNQLGVQDLDTLLQQSDQDLEAEMIRKQAENESM